MHRATCSTAPAAEPLTVMSLVHLATTPDGRLKGVGKTRDAVGRLQRREREREREREKERKRERERERDGWCDE